MALEVFDNATSVGTSTLLAAPLSATDEFVSVQDSASLALQLGYFRAIIVDPSNGKTELVMVTGGQNTALWQITRGIEGTTPRDFPQYSIIKHILTAEAIRSFSDQGGSLFDVKNDYGAVGDDVNDDWGAIQAAIDDCANLPGGGGGGIVKFPRTHGHYKISKALLTYVRVRLVGESSFTGGTTDGTIIKADLTKTAADFKNGGADPELAFMLKDGSSSPRTVSDGVTINGSTTVTSVSNPFMPHDANVNAIIAHPNLPPHTRIMTYVSASQVTVDNPAFSDGTASMTIDAGNNSFLHASSVEHIGFDPNGIPGLGCIHFWQPGENFTIDFVAANNCVALPRSVNDAVTNATTTINSPLAKFTSDDVNAKLSGDRIAANTKIDQVISPTQVIANIPATGSGSGGALTINRPTDAVVFDGGAPTGLIRSLNGTYNSGALLRLKNFVSGSWLIESLSGDNNGGGKLRVSKAAVFADPASITVVTIKSENWGGVIGGTPSPVAEDPVVLLDNCDIVALNILGGSFLNSWGGRDIVRLDQSQALALRGGPSLNLNGLEGANPFNPGYTNIIRDSTTGEVVASTGSKKFYPQILWARDLKLAGGASFPVAEKWRVSADLAVSPEWSLLASGVWNTSANAGTAYFYGLLRWNSGGALNDGGSWNVDLSAGTWDLVVLGATGTNAPIVSVDFAVNVIPSPSTHNTQRNIGGTVPAGTYQTMITFVTPGGQETTPSPALSSVLPDSTHQFQINPPSNFPDGVVSFNVYMTQAGGSTFTKQNAVPISIGQALILSAAPTNTGAAPPTSNGTAVWSSVVGTFDQYQAGVAVAKPWTISGITIPSHVGPVQVRFRALSKNASSTAYFMGLSAMEWRRTA